MCNYMTSDAEPLTDTELAAAFAPVAEELGAHEERIVQELTRVQGEPVDVGGYYHPDPARTAEVMRPSRTFNDILVRLSSDSSGGGRAGRAAYL